MPLGQGDHDLALLRTIRDSGYRGPIGILGHTQDDAEERLQDNLDGLDWLVPQLDGKPAGPKPRPRTYAVGPCKPDPRLARRRPRRVPHAAADRRVPGPARPRSGYNILVASDTQGVRRALGAFLMARNRRVHRVPARDGPRSRRSECQHLRRKMARPGDAIRGQSGAALLSTASSTRISR